MIRLFGYHHLNLKGLNFIQFESLEYKTKILIACKLGGWLKQIFPLHRRINLMGLLLYKTEFKIISNF
ncbi:hypothetical protein EC556_04730 [Helicobacter pylori]|nr:hypothetical protein EC556_04730 [Helicobacter pylori]